MYWKPSWKWMYKLGEIFCWTSSKGTKKTENFNCKKNLRANTTASSDVRKILWEVNFFSVFAQTGLPCFSLPRDLRWWLGGRPYPAVWGQGSWAAQPPQPSLSKLGSRVGAASSWMCCVPSPRAQPQPPSACAVAISAVKTRTCSETAITGM